MAVAYPSALQHGVARLVHGYSEGALAIDRDLRVAAWNARAQELLGFAADDVIGRPCCEVLQARQPDGRPICSETCEAAAAMRSGRPARIGQWLCRASHGGWVPVVASSLALPPGLCADGTMAIILLQADGAGAPALTAASEVLRVRTLGAFALWRADRQIPWQDWVRKQAVTLLQYLITHRPRVHREVLVEALWPDTDLETGLGRLKVVLYALRRYLTPAGAECRGDVIKRCGVHYCLDTSLVQVDVDEFCEHARRGEELLAAGRPAAALAALRRAEALYGGDYLADEPFYEWAVAERDRLRETFVALMEKIASLYGADAAYNAAIEACRRGLACEPGRESLHRSLMFYLWSAGRTDEAIRQYHLCCKVLQDELGTGPQEQTVALFRRIQG